MRGADRRRRLSCTVSAVSCRTVPTLRHCRWHDCVPSWPTCSYSRLPAVTWRTRTSPARQRQRESAVVRPPLVRERCCGTEPPTLPPCPALPTGSPRTACPADVAQGAPASSTSRYTLRTQTRLANTILPTVFGRALITVVHGARRRVLRPCGSGACPASGAGIIPIDGLAVRLEPQHVRRHAVLPATGDGRRSGHPTRRPGNDRRHCRQPSGTRRPPAGSRIAGPTRTADLPGGFTVRWNWVRTATPRDCIEQRP